MSETLRGLSIVQIDTQKATELGWFDGSGNWQYRPYLAQRKSNSVVTINDKWYVVYDSTLHEDSAPLVDDWEQVAIKSSVSKLMSQLKWGLPHFETVRVYRTMTADEIQEEMQRLKDDEEAGEIAVAIMKENGLYKPVQHPNKRYLLKEDGGSVLYEGKGSDKHAVVDAITDDMDSISFESMVVNFSQAQSLKRMVTSHHGVMTWMNEREELFELEQPFKELGLLDDDDTFTHLSL